MYIGCLRGPFGHVCALILMVLNRKALFLSYQMLILLGWFQPEMLRVCIEFVRLHQLWPHWVLLVNNGLKV